MALLAPPEQHHGDHAHGEQSETGPLDQRGAVVVVLLQEDVLFEETGQAPQGGGGGQDEADGPFADVVLDQDEDGEDDEAVEGLNQRDRHPLARLTGVAKPPPCRRPTAPSGHHQLRSEEPSHPPGGHEDGADDVEST